MIEIVRHAYARRATCSLQCAVSTVAESTAAVSTGAPSGNLLRISLAATPNPKFTCLYLMPKLYEYLGLVVFFYSNEHEPIHVHIEYGNYVTIAELYLNDGKVIEIVYKSKGSLEMLPSKQLKHAKELIEAKKDDIVEKWVDYFVKKKRISPTAITKRLKS